MFKKKISVKILQFIFSFLPQKFLCLFGTCKEACGSLSMEEDIENIESLRLKMHLAVCRKCWNYKHQMQAVNKQMVESLKSEIDEKLESETNREPGRDCQKEMIDKLTKKFSIEP